MDNEYIEYIKARQRWQIMRCAADLLEKLSTCEEPDFVAHVCDIVASRKLEQQELDEAFNAVNEYEGQQIDDYLKRAQGHIR